MTEFVRPATCQDCAAPLQEQPDFKQPVNGSAGFGNASGEQALSIQVGWTYVWVCTGCSTHNPVEWFLDAGTDVYPAAPVGAG